jgi:putative transposase
MTVHDYFSVWRKSGLWEKMNDELTRVMRVKMGKKAEPSALSIDSPTVRTTEKGGSGVDGGKKIKGRKRHIAVDTVGFLHKVYVTAANCSDRDGAKKVLGEVSKKCRKIQVI